jgi:subtilisin-like proprotein convertase family protein
MTSHASLFLGGGLSVALFFACAGQSLAAAPEFTVCSTSSQTFSATDLPKSINDLSNTISTLTVSSDIGRIVDLDLQLSIQHSANADLDILLVSPSGTNTVISSDNGASFDNVFNGTRFDDQAAQSVTSFNFQNNVLASTLVPEGALAKFKGEEALGNWQLQIFDDSAGSTGNLSAWSLVITTCTSPDYAILDSATFEDSVSANIPDNNLFVPLVRSLELSNMRGEICDVDLEIDVSHGNLSDLRIQLEGPAPAGIPIVLRRGAGFQSSFEGVRFSDQGVTPVSDATFSNSAFLEDLQPEGALAAFDSYDANTTWYLTLIDTQAGSIGTLNGWKLHVQTCGADSDGDSIADLVDSCPTMPNIDSDLNGVPACEVTKEIVAELSTVIKNTSRLRYVSSSSKVAAQRKKILKNVETLKSLFSYVEQNLQDLSLLSPETPSGFSGKLKKSLRQLNTMRKALGNSNSGFDAARLKALKLLKSARKSATVT